MRRWRSFAIATLAFSSGVAHAQAQAQDARDAEVMEARDASIPAAEPVSSTEAIWVAGASGGLLARDGGPDSPYGTLSLTRYRGRSYLRGALTAYGGTVRQIDAALPSTYYVGSIGAGGNWKDWVVDGYVSYGLQNYGQVETMAGKRDSQTGSGSPYVAAGLRAGRVFRPAPRWYVTPTLGLQYADTQSLRHRVDLMSGRAEDFQLSERAWTGNATLRVDRAIGRNQQHVIGLSLSHYESDNSVTSWRAAVEGNRPVSVPVADGWEQLGVSTTWRLSDRLWADTEIQRSLGAVAGNTTSIALGLRWRM